MRDLILMAMTAQGTAAICFAVTGTAPAQIARVAGSCMSRAHGILTASRTQNIPA
jgi:hypothetical protein